VQAGERRGDWIVDRPIGGGAMGAVLLARHARTGAPGALKLVSADTREDPVLTARFRREVEVLTTLQHPAVVRLLDAGEVDDHPWLVMEYVAGQTLEARVTDGRPPDLVRTLIEFAALADGLAHAHDLGIRHRDIKAANVIVDGAGRAVLVDFGVALHLSEARLTRAGNVMGTMAYLPPEVLVGGAPDGATHDQYALGQLLHEVLTRRLLHRGTDGEKVSFGSLLLAKGQALDPGPEHPEAVRAIVRRATDPEPAERFPSMREMEGALEAALTPPARADLARRLGRGAPPTRRWPWIVAGLAVLAVLGGCAAAAATVALAALLLLFA
jgi:serine/threonine protein kinase